MAEIAGQESTTPRIRNRTLRLALAMRGGVSLAVWIGGAVAEIDLFRRACNQAAESAETLVAVGENDHRAERAKRYAELLELTKYDRVDVDILAGASAGGLNAVLFGLAQACGTVMDEPVRRTWIDCGGIWDLLRDPGFGRVPSILKGDERLFSVVRDALLVIADPSRVDEKSRPLVHPETREDRVTVELAATLLDDPYNAERGNTASFSFTKTPGDLESNFTTIPSPDDDSMPAKVVALNRMALAARSTSSFPGAFEPAGIYSSPNHREDLNRGHIGHPSPNSRDDDDEDKYVNMSRAFLYARNAKTAAEPFNVVDGGIFDNIPIDRAIRAIRRAPTSQPAERWLIYLDPEPPTAPDPVTESKRTSSAASWVPVIRSSMALKERSETASDELRQLAAHNQSVLAARGRLEALAALLDDLRTTGPDTASVDEFISDQSYTQCRIATDTARFSTLLAEPWAELCQPPREAVDYAGLAPEKALALKDWVAAAYNDASVSWELPQDVYAKLDWVRILITWVHALEKLLEGLEQASTASANDYRELSQWLGDCKRKLYRSVTVLVEAKRLTTDLSLVEPLREDPLAARDYALPRLPAHLEMGRRLQRSLTIPTDLVTKMIDDGRDDKAFYTCLSKWSESRHEAHRCVVALSDAGHLSADLILAEPFTDIVKSDRGFLGRLTSNTGLAVRLREAVRFDAQYRTCLAELASADDDDQTEEGFEDALCRELNDLRAQIAQKTSSIANDPGDYAAEVWWRQWAESVYMRFYQPPLAGLTLDKLSRLFATAGISDSGSVIAFDEITGNERPEFDVRRLENGARAKQLRAWLRHLPKEEPMRRVLARPRRDILTADGKLAGNVMSRFGGFFRAQWRENDWQWGRLDAAAGIVKILNRARPKPLPADSQELRDHVADLQASIVLESWESVKVPDRQVGRDHPTIVENAGAEDVGALSPHYRFALASRIVPLVYRALLPPKKSHWSIGGIAVRFGQSIIRPLLVPLTLIADPLRLVLALAVILMASSFLGAARSQPEWQIAFLAMYFVAGMLIAIRAIVAHTRWKNLKKQLSSVAEGLDVWEWQSILERASKVKKFYIFGSYVLAAVTCGWAANHLIAVIHAVAERHDQVIAMPAEHMIATTALIVGLQHWLNKRAYRISAQPTTFRTVLADVRRHWVRRVLAVVAVIAGLLVLRISNVIANYQAAMIANCDVGSAIGRPICKLPRVGVPPWWWWGPDKPGPNIGLSSAYVKEDWWWDSQHAVWIVAGIAVALLILISLWGWVDNKWAIACTIVGAGLAGLVQWLVDDQLVKDWGLRDWRLWDLLPMLMWMAMLGAVAALLPVRRAKPGKPANYGETDMPVLR